MANHSIITFPDYQEGRKQGIIHLLFNEKFLYEKYEHDKYFKIYNCTAIFFYLDISIFNKIKMTEIYR
jgi:hypothetical protein